MFFYPELPTKTSETEILQYSYTYDDLHSSATVVEFGEKNGFVVMANNDNHTPLIVAKEGRFEEYKAISAFITMTMHFNLL